MAYKEKKYAPLTEEDRQRLLQRFFGEQGDAESETTICDTKADDTVSFYSDRGSQVCRVLERLRGAEGVLFQETHYGLFLEIPKAYTRGPGGYIKKKRGTADPNAPRPEFFDRMKRIRVDEEEDEDDEQDS